ncbi:dimethylarginine dimethylaminohydrolase family protein [Okeania sp. SIO2B3]|uniref:dimethylarginine dimethylaminohydrolase family protein n=1 Tax=Okeania sp. SIO2B3 TaxID=2607784 RepID=UPI0013C1E7A5|nr:arginine deiminase family protein [Okeania sp. SIO2B3]NET43072.1 hypothetical protein [Okeania sp. SIO2B3]
MTAELNSKNLGEFSLKPKAVLVHDPTPFGVFNQFIHIQKEEIQEYYLFRESPQPELYPSHHQEFVNALKAEIGYVFYLSDILSSSTNQLLSKWQNYLSKNPNLVFTRDAFITLPWMPDSYLPGKMGKKIRQLEPKLMSDIGEILGLKEILKIPDPLVLEGGDVIPFCHQNQRYLLIGYGRRTTKETLYFLQEQLIGRGIIDGIVGIELAQWRINLDGGMLPVTDDVIITHPESLINGILLNRTETQINPIHFFKDLGFQFIEVTQEESLYRLACNCFCLGERKIIAYDLSERVYNLLRQHHVNVIRVQGKELVKGIGGPRCMTRPIYKEITTEFFA